jgi:hypothetical protein
MYVRPSISAAMITMLTLTGGVAIVRAQSLAEVARQEQERRKTVDPASKVLTNEDLGDVPAVRATRSDPNAPEGPTPRKLPAPVAGTRTPVKDEAYWTARLKQLRAQVERNQILADALQSRINFLSGDFVAWDDPLQRPIIMQSRQRAIDDLAGLIKAIAEGRKAI